MRTSIALLLLSLSVSGCDHLANGLPGEEGRTLVGGTPAALAGVVATDSVTTVTRRVSAEDLRAMHVSPDGREFVVRDPRTGDIALHDRATGSSLRISGNTAAHDPGHGITGRVSPDGRRVAFTWEEPHAGRWDRFELRVATLDGNGVSVETIHSQPEQWPDVLDWSPDGEHLLFQNTDGSGTIQLELVPATGGEPRLLTTLGWSRPHGAGFSPDGRYIAFDFVADAEDGARHVHVISIDGTGGGPVSVHPSDDSFLGWAPDGHILFHSDRSGTPGVWRVAMQDGRATGRPELVKPDVFGISAIGFDREGRFYHRLSTATRHVHVLALDAEGTRIAAPPSIATSPGIASREPAWSPDGRYLAYVTGTNYGMDSDGHIVIRSLETGELRRVSLAPRVYGLRWLNWAPDGRSLLVRAGVDRGQPSLLRIDVQTGEMERTRIDGLGLFRVLPDGRSVVITRALPSESDGPPMGKVVVRDLETGRERVVVELATGTSNPLPQVAPSPDGETLAVAVSEPGGASIRLHPISGGEGREVVRVNEHLHRQTLSWTPDGRALLYVDGGGAPAGQGWAPGRLMRVDVETGEVRDLGRLTDGAAEFQVHPDGRRIAFVAGQLTSEIWALDEIGPIVPRASASAPR